VLNCIVERKRVSDFVASVADGMQKMLLCHVICLIFHLSNACPGRYEEQRRRLKKTGFSRVVYLIEGDLQRQQQLPELTVYACIAALTV
jgi:ERCC4-type nuclease